jgi:hypothetical protein
MTQSQTTALHASLRTIQTRFAELYGMKAGEKFAMEIEFKITAKGLVQIKQARRWIFN